MAQIDRLVDAVASTRMIRYLVVPFFVKRDRRIIIFSPNKNLEKRCSRIELGLRTVERLPHAVRGNCVLDPQAVRVENDRFCIRWINIASALDHLLFI